MPPKHAPVHKLGKKPPSSRAQDQPRRRQRRRKPIADESGMAPMDIRPAQTVTARPPKGGGGGGGGRRAAVPPPAVQMQKNADLYVAQLLSPFTHRGHRVPDLLSYPTAVTMFREIIQIVTAVDQTVQATIMPYPLNSSDNYAFYGNRAGASTFGVWARGQSDNHQTFTDSIEYFRTAAFGGRLVSTATVQTRGGSIMCGRYSNRGALPTTTTALARDPQFTLVAATGPGNDCMQTWRPSTYEAGLEFQPPVLDNTIPPEPVLVWEFAPTPGGEQTYILEVFWHIEFIPKAAQKPLLLTASAPGSASDVAASYMRAEAGAGDVDQQSDPSWSHRLAAAASRAADSPVGRSVLAAAGRAGQQYLNRALGIYPGSGAELAFRVKGGGLRTAAPLAPAAPPAPGGAAAAAAAALARGTQSEDDCEVVVIKRR